MKEDILEQIVQDYFLTKEGYFVKHNLKFRPSEKHQDFSPQSDRVHSDIDILAVKLKKGRTTQVAVVTCKSWQNGFKVKEWLTNLIDCPDKKKYGKENWKFFREITKKKWANAFIDAIEKETGSRKFTYYIAVTKCVGDPKEFENSKNFKKMIEGNPIKILTFENMFNELKEGSTTTVASSQIGRLIQVMNAAKVFKK